MWAAVILIVLIVVIQLYPWHFQGSAGGELFSREHAGPLAVILQIILFIPLGVVETELVRRFFGRRIPMTVLLVALDAVLLSMFCELGQYWLPDRISSIVDIVAAATGGVIGYLLAGFQFTHKCN